MRNDEISIEEWNALGAAEWAAILTREWNRPYVSLSAVVHWIATRGKLREADYDDFDELNDAAKTFVCALHDEKVTTHGSRDGSTPSPIHLAHISNIPAFFDDGREVETFGLKPYLEWNQFLEGDRDDVITDRCGRIHWRGLTIARADMLRLWPAKLESTPAWETELKARIAADPDYPLRTAISQMRQFATDAGETIPTNKNITAARKRFKGIEGPEKRGPKGPRKRPE